MDIPAEKKEETPVKEIQVEESVEEIRGSQQP